MGATTDMIRGRQTATRSLTNKSGGSVDAGDVVVIGDGTNDNAFTTTTTAGFTARMVGVAMEAIANNAAGLVAISGYVPKINTTGTPTRDYFLFTHTVAKEAAASATRAAGAFGQVLETGADPEAIIWGMPDPASSGSVTLSTGDSGVSGGTTNLPNNYTNYTDLASISLAAGTWLVIGECDSTKSAGGTALAFRTWDGTNAGGIDDHGTNGIPSGDHCHSMTGLHVLAGTTTVKLQGKANATGHTISKAHILAIKVA